MPQVWPPTEGFGPAEGEWSKADDEGRSPPIRTLRGWARCARGRPPAGAVLPCRVHPTAAVADIAYQKILLFKVSAKTLTTIAAEPKLLGAGVGITSVLYSWGSAITHHPHVHMIVPGGGISLDGQLPVMRSSGLMPG